MRITNLEIDPELFPCGLKSATMTRLGPVVVLAGPNGAGKTRLFKYITTTGAHRQHPSSIADMSRGWAQAEKELLLAKAPGAKINFRSVAALEKTALHCRTGVRATACLVTDDPRAVKVEVLPFVPQGLDIRPPEASDEETRLKLFGEMRAPGFSRSEIGCLAYVRQVVDRWVNARDLEVQASGNERAGAVESFERLRLLIKRLLHTTLARNLDGRVTLFGLPDPHNHLSDGQKVLIQLVVALHAQGTSLQNLILLLDEPENHLHPAALCEVIDRLMEVAPFGQIWIATHSIHLLARVDPDVIWYVNDGHVSHAGSTPERVLRGLVGNDDEVASLGRFLLLPATHAGVRFAEQCLHAPGVAAHVSGDKQTNQIHTLLKILGERRGRCLRVLDYGAGRGRLLAAAMEKADAPAEVGRRLDYFAFEPDTALHPEIATLLASVYGEDQRIFTTEVEFGRLAHRELDVAVMCNVLHEIPPSEWVRILGPGSELQTHLASDGYLLIVEDDRMPMGERAHQLGFLVLEEFGIRSLFAIEHGDDFTVDADGDPEKPGRLVAYLIPAKALVRVTTTTRRAGLTRTRKARRTRLEALRQVPAPTSRDGREHALLAQLIVNADLALEQL